MTFLDEFISNIASLPSDLHRNYKLMRELDEQLQVLQKQSEERCEHELEQIKRGCGHELEEIRRGGDSRNISVKASSFFRFSDDALAEQKDCCNIADEKVALAAQAYDLVDGHIQRLDKYMERFCEELRRGGAVAMDQNVDNSGRIARGNESGKPGRKRSQALAEPLNMDLDLPVDPNEPTYCFCNQVSYGEMIACDNPDCKIEWFHYGCVGIKERPKGKWYCPNCIGNDRRRKGK
uniref:PHD finger protein ING n=1 Tax=Araucaria cunninghamii TaxID=56994 RepID=A0A0D6R832_ARACU